MRAAQRDRDGAPVAIVGGGPAGAATAIHLRRLGLDVVLFERRSRPRWRACGVYSSPLTRASLAALGVSTSALERLVQPISEMVVETLDGSTCRLAYPAPQHACGLDRLELDGVLLRLAKATGVEVHEGATVRDLALLPAARPGPTFRVTEGTTTTAWRAGLVVGADGPRTIVGRAGGVSQRERRFRRAGLTLHRRDPDAVGGAPAKARMVIGRGWYCGIAPVPQGRVNIGIVVGERTLREAVRLPGGPAGLVSHLVAALPGPRAAWQDAPDTDELQVALPLAHRVRRAAGSAFLLVGDAAGFIDPLSGEGLHRALVSAEMAAEAIGAWSRGEPGALERYERRLRARFRHRDALSWLLQAFMAQPASLGYALRRLDRRPQLAGRFARGLADLEPAGGLLDPRFLVRLLRP